MSHGGNDSRKARAWCLANWPGICARCGQPLAQDDDWHAGHIIDDALGGAVSPDNYAPEHAKCNTSAGGKLAQTLKAQQRVTTDKHRPGFWFPARRSA